VKQPSYPVAKNVNNAVPLFAKLAILCFAKRGTRCRYVILEGRAMIDIPANEGLRILNVT